MSKTGIGISAASFFCDTSVLRDEGAIAHLACGGDGIGDPGIGALHGRELDESSNTWRLQEATQGLRYLLPPLQTGWIT